MKPIPATLAACLLALGLALPGPAQSAAPPEAGSAAAEAAASEAPARGFGGVELGMDRDAVIEALKKNYLFAYRGPEDVSLLPSPNQSLIEVSGLSFVKRGYFEGALVQASGKRMTPPKAGTVTEPVCLVPAGST